MLMYGRDILDLNVRMDYRIAVSSKGLPYLAGTAQIFISGASGDYSALFLREKKKKRLFPDYTHTDFPGHIVQASPH